MSERHLHAVEDRAKDPRPPAEIVAERVRVLEQFVARDGMDYWDHHDTAPDADPQLELESEAA